MPPPFELLAPAGSLDVFLTAVESGANAIYIGAPAANARALARPFLLEEIAAMTAYAHQKGVKLYVAMNSLVREEELPTIIRLLSILSGLGVDALIIQDLGVYHLARRYFPELRLHASTLMGAHNSHNIRQFTEMGFARIVLAREMSLSEITQAAQRSPAEIEVFVHGAMCFAYSGLCLFSSFLGGKSGLRGRCVQPCRRKYGWQGSGAKGGGYLFSMNDLEGIDLITDLRKAGVRSLKIEGRMRSRQYVGAVVRAYRLAIDHPNDHQALGEAKKILAQAMGRKTSTGYFLLPQATLPTTEGLVPPQKHSPYNSLIAHQHSGNIGLFVGKLSKCKAGGGKAELKLREPLALGDRLRIHSEKDGDRTTFTLKEIWLGGKATPSALVDQTIQLIAPESAKKGDPVYKVDSMESRQEAAKPKDISPQHFKKQIAREQQRERIADITARVCGQKKTAEGKLPLAFSPGQGKKNAPPRQRGRSPEDVKPAGLALPWWVKIDDMALLKHLPRHQPPARVIVLLTKDTLRQAKRLSLTHDQKRGMIWALPPIILEADLPFYGQAVVWLLQQGFSDWQLSHIGQRQFFAEEAMSGDAPQRQTSPLGHTQRAGKTHTHQAPRRSRLTFYGHYSLNILNSQAIQTLREAGLSSTQVSIEVDRNLLAAVAQNKSGVLGLTVYGFPPLFTARPQPDFFTYDQKFLSPKGEGFVLKKSFEQTIAVPSQPFSLLDHLQDIKAAGLDYVVIDLTANLFKRGDLDLLWRRLDGGRPQEHLSHFNYRGTLQ